MTQAAKRPSTATRRTGGSQPALNGHGPRGEQMRWRADRRRWPATGPTADDRERRRPGMSGTAPPDGPVARRRRRPPRPAGACGRGAVAGAVEEQWHGDRGELGDGREPRREPGGVQRTLEQVTDRVRSATSTGGDAFATHPRHVEGPHGVVRHGRGHDEAAAAVLRHVLGAGNTNDRNTTKV